MGTARARLTRNGLASLAVVAVLAAVGLGLPALNARIPATHALPPGHRYPVAAGVSVLPPPGAQYDVTRTATSRDGSEGAVLFVLGNVRLTVVVLRFDGSLAQAARQLRATITRARGYQALGREEPTRTSAGVAGLGGPYTTATGTGRYAVFVAGGLAVQATFAGAELPGSTALPMLQESVASIVFGRA